MIYITSDIHLGSPYCHAADFTAFVAGLPSGATLVLNGDVVDKWHAALEGAGLQALDLLRKRSRDLRVVWVRGNHDDRYTLPDPAGIEMRSSFAVGRRLYVAHGYDFDNVMPYNVFFLRLFRALHHLRILLGAEAVHVAHYAKKWAPLYNVLRRHVAMNAIEYARENGYQAVTCGHTHSVDDVVVDGIRYLNTGAWTEPPHTCLIVGDAELELVRLERGAEPPRSARGMGKGQKEHERKDTAG